MNSENHLIQPVFTAKRIIIAFSIIICLVAPLLLLGYFRVMAPEATFPFDFLYVIPMMFILLGSILYIAYCLIMLFSKDRRLFAGILLFILCFLVALPLCFKCQSYFFDVAMNQIAKRGRSLVAAIKAYEKVHGYPPKKLEHLSPKYLTKIPSAGFDGNKFIYVIHADMPGWRKALNNPWLLEVQFGPFSTEELIYLPLQNQKFDRQYGEWQYSHGS